MPAIFSHDLDGIGLLLHPLPSSALYNPNTPKASLYVVPREDSDLKVALTLRSHTLRHPYSRLPTMDPSSSPQYRKNKINHVRRDIHI